MSNVDYDFLRYQAAVNDWDARLGPTLSRPVVPVLCGPVGAATHVGTGVLLKAGDQVIFVTAAHVPRSWNPNIIGIAGKLTQIPTLRLTPIPPGLKPEDDLLDVGAGLLPAGDVQRLSPADAVPMERLDLSEQAYRLGNQFYLIGFPVSRQPAAFVGHEWNVRPFKLIAEELPPEVYGAAQIDSRENLILDFDKQDVYRDGRLQTAPDLYGVSGGAIYRLDGGSASRRKPLLAAIATTWHKRGKPPRIVATRISTIVRVLRAYFPELSLPSLPILHEGSR